MSQFYNGLIAGFLCSLFVWLVFDGNFEEGTQPQVTETTVVETEPSSLGRSTELTKDSEIVEKVLTQNPSIIIGEQEPACEKEMNCLEVNEKTSRSRILSMLDQLQAEELPLVEKILKHWNDKIPSEYFQTEKIDSEWSLKKAG